MEKNKGFGFKGWHLLKQLLFVLALMSCASVHPRNSGSDSEDSDHSVVDIASSWMAQSAFEDGDFVGALTMAYSWHREQPESWMSIDFIGDMYFCLNQVVAAKINYQLASNLAKASKHSVKLIDAKIQAIEGNRESAELVNSVLICPDSKDFKANRDH